MRVYMALLKLRVYHGLQYRIAALAGIATQFFWGTIMIMVFLAFYGDNVSVGGFSTTQLVTYIWLQQAFLSFIVLWLRDTELFELIRTGNIAYELCRPLNVYGFWYTKLIATRIANAMLRCMPILVVAMFIPEKYRMSMPESTESFMLFIVTLILGLAINVAISMFIYISVFVTLSPMGSLLIFSVVGEFFAGLVIPIPLMPEWLRNIVMVLPFRYVGDLPFRVYSGNIPPSEAFLGIAIQIVWLTALILFGKKLMQSALKHLVVQGG